MAEGDRFLQRLCAGLGGLLPVTLHLVHSLAGLEAGDYSLGLGHGVPNCSEMPD